MRPALCDTSVGGVPVYVSLVLKMDELFPTAIPESDEALRSGLRHFLNVELAGMSPDLRARSWLGFDAGFSRALAEHGWIGITFPEQYGGGGRGLFSRFVLAEELLCAGAPVSAHWIADRQSGPLLLKYGTEEQKHFYLPKIARAEAFFCIGMSEPDSGSDLASVRTRATQIGGGWVLNGQKVWTTNAHQSHYMIALVRTSGQPSDRHKGLSQVLIDLSLPGVTIRPITDLAGDQGFSEVIFDNVLLSEDALIGEEGDGWAQVIAELGFERSGPERIYSSMVLIECWLAWLRNRPAVDAGSIATLGRLVSWLSVLRAMSLSLTGKLARGEDPTLEATLVKDLGTEIEQLAPRLIGDHLAAVTDERVPVPLLRTLSYLEQMSPSFSLRGGTREILRGIIARGLGLR